MYPYILPVLFTLFLWWFCTGIILYLDGLPRWTFKWTMFGASLILALAFCGLYVASRDTRPTGAYLAFFCALMIWGWQEVAFLLGYVTGPRRIPCPSTATGMRRVSFALMTVLHHEAALLVLGVAVVVLSWQGSNHTGLWTFAILWIMRQSAKLNLFLGVRNLNEGFLPLHLRYLQSYFMRASMNRLFPFSIFAATAMAVLVWREALSSNNSPFEVASLTFLATLISLALLEHWFMVIPLPSEALWKWGLRSRGNPEAAHERPADMIPIASGMERNSIASS